MHLLQLSMLLLAACSSVYGQFSTTECETLAPSGIAPETESAPFIVALTSSTYTPGSTVPVQVFIASSNSSFTARGVILQARRTSSNAGNTPVGTFNEPSGFQLLSCGSSSAGTVTNSNNDDKSLPFLFMWTPPTENYGTVQFVVSLTDGNGRLWSNEASTTSLSSTAGELDQLSIANCPAPTITGNVATWTPPNCLRGTAVQSQATCAPPSGTTFPVGTSTSVCTCSDRAESVQCTITVDIAQTSPCMPNPCNNGGTCIEVPGFGAGFVCQCPTGFPQPTCQGTVTNTPPTLICPSTSLSVTAPAGSNQAVVVYNPFQCTDTQDGTLTATCNNNPSGSLFNIGTTPVTCTCTDSGSLTSTCTFNVIVNSSGGPCVNNPCMGNECRTSATSLAGYTCHSVTGVPCNQ